MRNSFASSGGQAAGRDIHNLNIHLGNSKPESQLQAEFAQRTGIWCPKPAREWLEGLLENHPFTVKELADAWKFGTLGWQTKQDTQKVVTSRAEAIYAYSMLAGLGLYFLASALVLLNSEVQDTKAIPFILFGGAVFFGVCWMAKRFMLQPHWVALRVEKITKDIAGL